MGEPLPAIRRTVLYSGTVQGVGFRYTTERVAARFSVSGWVRNLPDGRVELVVEGEPGELDRLVAAVDRAMYGYIRSREVREAPATGECAGFGIRH